MEALMVSVKQEFPSSDSVPDFPGRHLQRCIVYLIGLEVKYPSLRLAISSKKSIILKRCSRLPLPLFFPHSLRRCPEMLVHRVQMTNKLLCFGKKEIGEAVVALKV